MFREDFAQGKGQWFSWVNLKINLADGPRCASTDVSEICVSVEAFRLSRMQLFKISIVNPTPAPLFLVDLLR